MHFIVEIFVPITLFVLKIPWTPQWRIISSFRRVARFFGRPMPAVRVLAHRSQPPWHSSLIGVEQVGITIQDTDTSLFVIEDQCSTPSQNQCCQRCSKRSSVHGFPPIPKRSDAAALTQASSSGKEPKNERDAAVHPGAHYHPSRTERFDEIPRYARRSPNIVRPRPTPVNLPRSTND